MNLKINKKDFMIWMCLAVLLLPQTTAHYSGISTVVKIVKIIAFLYAMLCFINKHITIKKCYLPTVCWFVWMFATTIIHGGNLYGLFSLYYPIIATMIILEYALARNPSKTIVNLSIVLTLIAFINLLTYFGGGLYVDTEAEFGDNPIVYFIGLRVAINRIALFAIAITYIAKQIGKHKERYEFWICTLSITAFVIFNWVSTTIVALGITFLLVILWKFINRNKLFDKFIMALSIIFVILAIYSISNNEFLDNFAWLIEGLLHKSVTLTGRTTIWAEVLSQIKGASWVIGNGYGTVRSFMLSNGLVTSTSHSEYLSILYNYGIIGLLLFLVQMFSTVKNALKFSKSKSARFCVAVVFGSLCTCITSGFIEMPYFAMFWVIANNIDTIVGLENI